jgi:hypothetical protein
MSVAMAVDNVTTAPARRTLRFRSFDEALQDAATLNERGYTALGNWSLGRALGHLGQAIDLSIDGPGFSAPLKRKLLGRLLYRHYLLHIGFPAGVQLPADGVEKLVPGEMSYEAGRAVYERAIDRLSRETRRIPHPILGRFSIRQWNVFHLRHADLHLSFLLPK